jgi:hypothetical protein
MAAPPFVAEYESAWNVDTTPKTQSVTVNNGDLLVIVGVTADSVTTLNTPTGGGLTYTARGAINVSSRCSVYAWSAPATSGQTFTLSVTRSGTTGVFWGFNVLRFSGSAGIGANPSTNAAGAAPTLNVTASQANSAIVVVSADWNAVDGTSRTWRANAGALTEVTYFRDSGQYTVYAGYHADAGTATTDAVGLSAPAGQTYSIIAVEVLGSSGTAVTPGNAAGTVAGHNPATAVTPTVGSPVGTVAANNPAPSLSARPGDATVAVAGQNPGTSVTSPPSEATGTLAAAAPTVSLSASGAGASGVVTGNNAAPTVTPNAVGAALSVGALNATVNTSGGTQVAASEATVGVSSPGAATAVTATAIAAASAVAAPNPAPAVAPMSATAGAAVSAPNASSRVNANAQSAGITVSAVGATVTVPGATNANAPAAGIGMSAMDATVAITTRALEATLSAAATVATNLITTLAERAVITLSATDVASNTRGGHMSSVDRAAPGMTSADRSVSTMRGA